MLQCPLGHGIVALHGVFYRGHNRSMLTVSQQTRTSMLQCPLGHAAVALHGAASPTSRVMADSKLKMYQQKDILKQNPEVFILISSIWWRKANLFGQNMFGKGSSLNITIFPHYFPSVCTIFIFFSHLCSWMNNMQ